MRLFEHGDIAFTPGAIDFLKEHKISWNVLLARHLSGDWGDLEEEDKKENELSVKEGFRILSSYKYGDEKIWIITEADRSATTFLLPEEY